MVPKKFFLHTMVLSCTTAGVHCCIHSTLETTGLVYAKTLPTGLQKHVLTLAPVNIHKEISLAFIAPRL